MAELFAGLRGELVPMVRAVAAQQDGREAPLHGGFDVAAQETFGREVVERFGYDWRRGRQDRAVHPFCTGIGPDDVRITTRFDRAFLSTALFSTLHEAGHAMYEQGIAGPTPGARSPPAPRPGSTSRSPASGRTRWAARGRSGGRSSRGSGSSSRPHWAPSSPRPSIGRSIAPRRPRSEWRPTS
jgi:hypothetical protein